MKKSLISAASAAGMIAAVLAASDLMGKSHRVDFLSILETAAAGFVIAFLLDCLVDLLAGRRKDRNK